jgi:hypothetical protein
MFPPHVTTERVILFFYESLNGIDPFVPKGLRIAALAAVHELFTNPTLSFNSVWLWAKSRFPDLLKALVFRSKAWCCWNRISWRTLHVLRIDGHLQDFITNIPDRLNGQAAGLRLPSGR